VTPQPKPPAKLSPGALDSLRRLIESTAAREGMGTTEVLHALGYGREISEGDGEGKDVNAAMQGGKGDGKGKGVNVAPRSGKGGGTSKDVIVALHNGKGDGKDGNAYHVAPRPSAAGDLPDTVVGTTNGDVQLAPEALKK
ncbi:unnamed protein product, partial [Prorocentrum cordatum]